MPYNSHDIYDHHPSRRTSYTSKPRRRSESPSEEYISHPTYSSSDYIQRPRGSSGSHYRTDSILAPEPTYRVHYYTRPSYHRSSSSDYISPPEESRHDYISPSPSPSSRRKTRRSNTGIRVRFSSKKAYVETDSIVSNDERERERVFDSEDYDSSDIESISNAFYKRDRRGVEYAGSDIESFGSGVVSSRDSGHVSRSPSGVSRSCSESDGDDDEDVDSVGSVGSVGTRAESDYASDRGRRSVCSDICPADSVSVSGDDGGVYMDGYNYYSDDDEDSDY